MLEGLGQEADQVGGDEDALAREVARVIGRNQIVRLRFQRGALQIDTEGRAMSDGAAGELIRVMNMGSRSTVTAQVMPDGTLAVTN